MHPPPHIIASKTPSTTAETADAFAATSVAVETTESQLSTSPSPSASLVSFPRSSMAPEGSPSSLGSISSGVPSSSASVVISISMPALLRISAIKSSLTSDSVATSGVNLV